MDTRNSDVTGTAGHVLTVIHNNSVPAYRVKCQEPVGANCRLVCPDGCETFIVERDGFGPHHFVPTFGEPIRHDLVDYGRCSAVELFDADPEPEYVYGTFVIGSVAVQPTYVDDELSWVVAP